jgi:hypothetical protein
VTSKSTGTPVASVSSQQAECIGAERLMGGWDTVAAAKVMPNSSRLSDANVSDMVVCEEDG